MNSSWAERYTISAYISRAGQWIPCLSLSESSLFQEVMKTAPSAASQSFLQDFSVGIKKKKCSWQATQELRRCHVVQPIVCSWENQRLPYSSWKGIDKGQRCFTLLGTGLNSSLYPLCSRSSLPQLYCIIRMASSRSAALCWLLWLYPATIVSEFCILFHGEHRDRCRASFLPKVSRNCWYLLQKDLFMRNFEMEDKWEEKHRP